MEFTKKTIVTWAAPIDNTSIADSIRAKISSMVNEGKTDGKTIQGPEMYDVTRLWVDQAAAEEWTSWITETCATFNLPLPSTSILDNN